MANSSRANNARGGRMVAWTTEAALRISSENNIFMA